MKPKRSTVVLMAAIIVIILFFGVVLLNRVSKQSVMESMPPFEQCDLNTDGVCNATDYNLFQQVKSQCRANFTSTYSIYADADADGCVTDKDEQMLFPTTKLTDVSKKIKTTNDRSCTSNDECPGGYQCYNPPECGLGPNGPVPCPLKDDLCHKGCASDSDCPSSAPRCLSVPWSDYAVFEICFK